MQLERVLFVASPANCFMLKAAPPTFLLGRKVTSSRFVGWQSLGSRIRRCNVQLSGRKEHPHEGRASPWRAQHPHEGSEYKNTGAVFNFNAVPLQSYSLCHVKSTIIIVQMEITRCSQGITFLSLFAFPYFKSLWGYCSVPLKPTQLRMSALYDSYDYSLWHAWISYLVNLKVYYISTNYYTHFQHWMSTQWSWHTTFHTWA